MFYTKIKRYNLKQLLDYLNQYKDIPWIFYDIETTGLQPLEKIKDKNLDKFWIHKPAQITQLSASAFLPRKTGRYLNQSIDWTNNWSQIRPKEVNYKKTYNDIISDKGEFNEKCGLNKHTYNQLNLEKLVNVYVNLLDSEYSEFVERIHKSILDTVKKEYKFLSKDSSEILKNYRQTFDNLAMKYWNSSRFDRQELRRDFISTITRFTSIILSDSKKGILIDTSYFDEHWPDGSEKELLKNFSNYIKDIKLETNSNEVLMVGQNNSNFDHKFIDKRCNLYNLPHNNSLEFDLRGVTKYLLHPEIIKYKDSKEECKSIYETLFVGRADPKKSYLSARLGDLAKAFDVTLTNWHNAIFDVRATKSVLFEMMRFLINLKEEKNNETLDTSSTIT